MKLPEQAKDIEDAAYTPYNFVPLPNEVVPAQKQEPVDQSVYHTDRYTGSITCTLTTESPLYIRCGSTSADFADYGDKRFDEINNDLAKKRRAQFFHINNPEQPVIPGSSLRGMLRSLVEIASFSKIERVFDRQLFYRSIKDDNYREQFTVTLPHTQVGTHPRAAVYQSRVKAGYIDKRDGLYVIRECAYARIDTNPTNPQGIATIPTKNGTSYNITNGAESLYQHEQIYVAIDDVEQDYFYQQQMQRNGRDVRHPDLYLRFRAVRRAAWVVAPNLQLGRLVLTGSMPNKHLQFVFLDDIVQEHSLPLDLKERFEDDDQITPFQAEAFPQSGGRTKDGGLRIGEPVFFLLNDDDTVRFFGRAQLFRLPYGRAPLEFVPDELRFGKDGTEDAPVQDIAETLFGFVRQTRAANAQTTAGRVFISDAHVTAAVGPLFLTDTWLTPKILASPKPTTYQHYLVQDKFVARTNNRRRYNNSSAETTIRGHKIYWHRRQRTKAEIEEQDAIKIQRSPRQYTRIRPINTGVTFEFTLKFENLSDVELGALLWVLRIASDPDHRLKLGMGKPLGMGAIKLESSALLDNRSVRYGQLLDNDRWVTGTTENLDASQRVSMEQPFHTYILNALGEQKVQTIDELPRIKDLLTLLAWPGPDPSNTRYMEIERPRNHKEGVHPSAGKVNSQEKQNEYVNRPILARPDEVYTNEERRNHRNERIERKEPQLPVEGDVFGGEVLAVDPQLGVRIKVKNIAEDVAIGVIKTDDLAGKQYQVNGTARVKVIGIRTKSSGLKVYDLKPELKKRK